LNVAHVLEGSVRKAGNRVRITAQLIEARSDTHLWSESYDRELDDIFAVQDEIAAAISDALKMKLALVAGESVLPTAIKTANTNAYDAYLRGRELIRLRGLRNLQDAIGHLERSLRLDETFAPAHAQLAMATILLTMNNGPSTLEETRRRAIPHLDRALELEPDLAEAHGGRAMLAWMNREYEAVIEHARKALASNPNYVDAMYWLGYAFTRSGRYDESFAIAERVVLADPLATAYRGVYRLWLSLKGRINEAHEQADLLLALKPAFGYAAHSHTSLTGEGKIAESLSWAFRGLAEDASDYDYSAEERVSGFIWVGEYDEARRVNDELAWVVDVVEGRFDEAIQATQKRMQRYPEKAPVISSAANVLYEAGRIAEALPLFERLRDFVPEGRPIEPGYYLDIWHWHSTMRLALARRIEGDEEGAQAAVQIVRQDLAAFSRVPGRKTKDEYLFEAMIAAFEHNPDDVIAALKSAIQLGLRDPRLFDDLIFEDLWHEPRFVALQQELDALLAVEHDKVLQLICFNNPVPDYCHPLPETCEGVEEQSKL
jgi:tetratricopeptide (TPR) repeat protein